MRNLVSRPTVHLNGTSKQDLLQGYAKALIAVEAAANAVANTNPHGRDYYPQGEGALRLASDQHRARLYALRDVAGELAIIVNSLQPRERK